MLLEILLVRECVQTAKVLADAVIPNEYGIDPGSKLRIGSKICCALLGKLLADLANMREESLATAVRASTSFKRDVACWALLGKLLAGLAGMRVGSLATAVCASTTASEMSLPGRCWATWRRCAWEAWRTVCAPPPKLVEEIQAH